MAKTKFPSADDVPWGEIKEIVVTSDKDTFSFEFKFKRGKRKEKMTIAVSPQSTSYTLSTDKNVPILHAVQKEKEIRVLDFTGKPGLVGAAGKLRKIKKIKKTTSS